MLTLDQVLAGRYAALLLSDERGHALTEPPGDGAAGRVVTHLGALQAQDHQSGLWSVGARLPGVTRAQVAAALEAGEVLRTWPMRGTVHLVPARDARWMLDLMSAKPLATGAARRRQLGITLELAERAVAVLGDALQDGRLTRSGCTAALRASGIDTSGQIAYHLLWYASQRGVTCIAGEIDGEQAFALLDHWAPAPVILDRDQALAEIAARYVRGHGPVTEKDLARWTGLGLRDCRTGVSLAGDRIRAVDTEAGPMLAPPAREHTPEIPEWLALPGFDELVLGYADRSLQLPRAHEPAVVPGGNGVFRSTLAHRGRVVATWTRTPRARHTVVDVHPFSPISARSRRGAEGALEGYGAFIEGSIDVHWH